MSECVRCVVLTVDGLQQARLDSILNRKNQIEEAARDMEENERKTVMSVFDKYRQRRASSGLLSHSYQPVVDRASVQT